MIVTRMIPDRDIRANARNPEQAAACVRSVLGRDPSRITHDRINRCFVCEIETSEIIESTASVVALLPGESPTVEFRRPRRHPKEGTWPNDVKFSE